MNRRLTILVPTLVLIGGALRAQEPANLVSSRPLEQYLEALRRQAGVPGMSAAIVQEGQIIWEHAFGFQDQEARIRATPDTPYAVGGLSQSIAAVLLLQCVEQRRLELDGPVRTYGLALPESNATLRHVLSHSSADPAGAGYQLALDRYSQLNGVMEWCAPQPYRKSAAHRVLERLAMKDSVPGADMSDPAVVPEGLFDPADLERYARVLQRIAVPYRVDRRGRATRNDEVAREHLTAASGLVSTVRDLAQFDAALDSGVLLLEETRTLAWSNAYGGDGVQLPTGLGWFVQTYGGQPVVWQFGQIDDAYGALMIRLPARRTTFILLANSSALNAPFELHQGDVTRSLFAMLFLRLFVGAP
jgi:CubicO group peptidase (beta-lactamase class C family)